MAGWDCAGSERERDHCWHYVGGWMVGTSLDPDPPWELACCDCGAKATIGSLNRRRHGDKARGPRLELRQYGKAPALRVVLGGKGGG